MKADLVSLKVDAVRERAWRQVDRPHGRLKLSSILEGMKEFARRYRGRLLSETLLVHGANDSEAEVTATAAFIAELKPQTAYLSIPTRPPSEEWVRPPSEAAMNRAYQVFASRLERVECLIAADSGTFGYTGNVEGDILATAAVHPMRKEAVRQLLGRANADWSVVEKLVESKELVELVYRGDTFYFRKLPRVRREPGERANA
jgi:wyosine [tRNA(Phe)-imidazoG37] synthetase (radical SAM superfamily)